MKELYSTRRMWSNSCFHICVISCLPSTIQNSKIESTFSFYNPLLTDSMLLLIKHFRQTLLNALHTALAVPLTSSLRDRMQKKQFFFVALWPLSSRNMTFLGNVKPKMTPIAQMCLHFVRRKAQKVDLKLGPFQKANHKENLFFFHLFKDTGIFEIFLNKS